MGYPHSVTPTLCRRMWNMNFGIWGTCFDTVLFMHQPLSRGENIMPHRYAQFSEHLYQYPNDLRWLSRVIHMCDGHSSIYPATANAPNPPVGGEHINLESPKSKISFAHSTSTQCMQRSMSQTQVLHTAKKQTKIIHTRMCTYDAQNNITNTGKVSTQK